MATGLFKSADDGDGYDPVIAIACFLQLLKAVAIYDARRLVGRIALVSIPALDRVSRMVLQKHLEFFPVVLGRVLKETPHRFTGRATIFCYSLKSGYRGNVEH